MSTPTVGIVANPASARDVRRLAARASAVTAHHKVNVLERIMAGLSRGGAVRVLSMIDRSGVSAGLARSSRRSNALAWPELRFVNQEITGTGTDTVEATRRMVEAGVSAIVVVGGDGTHRLVASVCEDTPLVGISTGTNNAFPLPLEPTVAGLAAGLVAAGQVDVEQATERAKLMTVTHRGQSEPALVDVAVLGSDRVGAGAIWELAHLQELYLCFAQADAIGLSAIGGHLQPVNRHEPWGLAISLARTEPSRLIGASGHRRRLDDLEAGTTQPLRLQPPVGPGLFADVTVDSWHKLSPGEPHQVNVSTGVVAIDGERMFRFDHTDAHHSPTTITLSLDGPRVINVPGVLDLAAAAGVLTEPMASSLQDHHDHTHEGES